MIKNPMNLLRMLGKSLKHRNASAGYTLCLVFAFCANPAHAQTWPTKPIKVIVPYAVGQGTDIITRYIGEALTQELGQPIIVENRPGAGGNVGTQAAARAPADGYTLMIGTNATHAANTYLYSNTGFDAQADFEPVSMIGILPLVFVTKPDNPINSIEELVQSARAKPDSLNIAISTTTCRVAYELFKVRANAPLFPVDFKGSAQGVTAVMGGQVEYMVDTIASLRGPVQNKQVKALGVTSTSSSKLLPGVKSLSEQGVKGYELVGWTVMFAPKGTPEPALRALAGAMERTLGKPAVQEKLMQMGIEPQRMSRDELKKFTASERGKWGELIHAAGIKPMS